MILFGRKACPRCAERVRTAALICRYCGYDFMKLPLRRTPNWAARLVVAGMLVAIGLGAVAFWPAPPRGVEPPAISSAPPMQRIETPPVEEPALPELLVGATLEWVAQDAPDELIRRAGPYMVKLRKAQDGDFVAPVVEVSGEAQSVRMEGSAASAGMAHKLALIQNMRGGAPVLMLQSFSGGAHCCTSVQLAGFSSGTLKVLDLGSWDGEGIDVPEDLNGDGLADFVFGDNAFLYAFASYASSHTPPKILNVRGGKVVDVSRHEDFTKLFLSSMNNAREPCVSGDSGDERNGACPAFVASAARVGKLEEAWRLMTTAYDPATGWSFPSACRVAVAGECPESDQIPPKSYPEALLHFLKRLAYVPRGWQPPEFFAPDPAPLADGVENETI